MFKAFFKRLAEWSGDRHLDEAIHRELRRGKYAVLKSRTSNMRLIAIQPPGWVQVRRFVIDTTNAAGEPVALLGLARDDGRQSRIEVLLTTDTRQYKQRMEQWCDGLIRRGV